MSYFVTGATGFIGRHLIERLLERDAVIHVLVRDASRQRFAALHAGRWDTDERIRPVSGDLERPGLGVDPGWIDAHRGSVAHVLHLAAIYDLTAGEESNERLNVAATQSPWPARWTRDACTTSPRSPSPAPTAARSPRTCSPRGSACRRRITGPSSRPSGSCATRR